MSEVKLLPLPEELKGRGKTGAIKHYARANMEPLIAENERLRAEVDEWKRRGEAYFQTAERQGKRAERLAEALRKIAHFKLSQFTGPYDMACACVYEASAALDQEGGK